MVTTPDKSLGIDATILSELYDLTRAEAGIASSLLEGFLVVEIAARQANARETARSQVKRVLAKTGYRSQSDFIGRLAPLSALHASRLA